MASPRFTVFASRVVIPRDHSRWRLRLIAETLVRCDVTDVESVSHETVRQTFKNEFQPHRPKRWVIPPDHVAEVVYFGGLDAGVRLDLVN